MTTSAPGSFEHRFAVQERIGAGGMGVVYRAVDRTTGRHVAVKVMKSDDAGLSERFSREASALEQLVHPAIVGFVAAGWTSSAAPYLAMEWVDGETLAARLARGPLSVEDGVALAIRLADGLEAAHGRGIVHRDLKPANIVLHGGEPSRARILDFGIARLLLDAGNRLTMTGEMIGTPAFMAPEQARGDKDLDHRVDLYSLGCVVFRSLTGRNVFDGDEVMAVVLKALLDPAPRLGDRVAGVPPDLEALVASLLAKSPHDRPASAAVVADALRAIAAGLPRGGIAPARPRSPPTELGATSTQATRREQGAPWTPAVLHPTAVGGGTPAPRPSTTLAGAADLATTGSRRTVWAVGAIATVLVLAVLLVAAFTTGSLPIASMTTGPCPVERCEPLDVPDPSRVDVATLLSAARAAALRAAPRSTALQFVMVHGMRADGHVDLTVPGNSAVVGYLDGAGLVLSVTAQQERLLLSRSAGLQAPEVPAPACDVRRAIAAAAAGRALVSPFMVRLDAMDTRRRGIWVIWDAQRSAAEIDAQTCAVISTFGGGLPMQPAAGESRPSPPSPRPPGPARSAELADPFGSPF